MRFHKAIEFTGSFDRVRELLLDPDFREEVAREAGAEEVVVSVDAQSSGSAVAMIDTRQPTTGMPALATKFLGGELAVHQEERWATPESGTMLVTIPGQPGRVEGTVTLEDRNGVVVQTVDADITVKIPLVGGKVEKLIGSVVGHVLKIQEQTANERLR